MMKLCESPSTKLTPRSGKTLSGLFAEFDTKNQNERIYPKDIYENALNEILPKIKEGRLLGECDHPNDRDEVCLSNVSHVIRECSIRDNKVYGTVELLDTPSGKIAQALVEAGIPLGISSRGVGNTKRVHEGEEVTDLKLITFDLVADPSFSNAVLSESAKIKLKSRLDGVANSLPLNESVGNDPLRSRINDLKTTLDKSPTVTTKLVESIGDLTGENLSIRKKLTEAVNRNKFLSGNMVTLQESYNTLAEAAKSLESKCKDLTNGYESRIKSIKESHNLEIKSMKEKSDKEISNLKESLIQCRKELSIEKRGLSKDSIMPILEGLESQEEIDNKLDTVKHLSARRYSVVESVKPQTAEATTSTRSKLSKIISSI